MNGDRRPRLREALGSPWLRVAALAAVVAAGVWALAAGGDLGAVVDRIAAASPAPLAAAAVVYVASWPLRGARYRRLLGGMGHRVDVRAATAAVFVSQTANLVAPLRSGDASRAYLVRHRHGVPYRVGGASLVVERVLDLGAVAVLGAAGAAPLAGMLLGASGSARTALAAAAVAAVGAAVTLAALQRGVGRRFAERAATGRLAPLGRFVEEVLDGFAATGRTRGVWLESLGIWALDVATALLVAVALGLAVEAALVPAMLLAVSAGNLAKVVPATPGGVGLYEGAFAAVAATVLPIGVAAAVAVAVVDHGVKNAVTVAGGAVAVASLGPSSLRSGPSE